MHGDRIVLPLTNLRFSSSFICSAKSRLVPLLADASAAEVPLEGTVLANSLDLLEGLGRSAGAGGNINGETAILEH